MKTGLIVNWSFFFGLLITFLGALMKLMHWANADTLLIIGVLIWLIFIVTALYEVNTSTRITRTAKLMWTVAFILMAGIAGIVYVLAGRKMVAGAS
jgi:hypothetical protein